MNNALYYGDNLNVLRETIADESVDLIYLDPPFNSARDYNILFASPKGEISEAQITVFEDSWHWGEQAEREFDEILRSHNTAVAEMMDALRRFMGENDMMAYLTMMSNRLLELHRVLKPTGSLNCKFSVWKGCWREQNGCAIPTLATARPPSKKPNAMTR